MKKFLVILSIIVFLGSIICCSNGNSNNTNENNNGNTNGNPEEITDSLYEKIGKVNKVYEAYSAARFYTGQEITNFYGCPRVRFSGVLVEYDSLDAKIVEYVSSLPKANAYMHQGYDGIVYKPEEIYVEFSTYTDVENECVIAHEIRIFSGNFMDDFDGSSYAKSVMFDPSLTIDIDRNKNVYTGKSESYQSDYNFGTNIECSKAVNEYPESFKKFGEISNVYVVVTCEDEIKKGEMNDAQYYITYYAEYKSFNEKTIQYYNNRKADKQWIWYAKDFYVNENMKYIQFQYVFDKTTNKMEWAQAYITDPKDFPDMNAGAFINTIYFYEDYPDLYEKVKYLAPAEYKQVQVTDCPDELSKSGNLEKVYAYVFSNGSIATDIMGISWRKDTYIAEYSDFNETTKKAIKEGLKDGVQYGNGHYSLHKDGKKYIEFMKDYQDRTSLEGNFYDSDITDRTVGISANNNSELYDYIVALAAGAQD